MTENLLLVSRDDDTTIKLADFGFATRVAESSELTGMLGTPGYICPEMLCFKTHGNHLNAVY